MLDALEAEAGFLRQLRPGLCLEVGSGSGCISTFLATLLQPHPAALLATDINPYANAATTSTAAANAVSVEAVRTSLAGGLRLAGLVDVLLFNPPYVPTEHVVSEACGLEASAERCLEAAWAGGPDGRYWIDQLLPQVHRLLSPGGVFYMVAVQENRPAELMAEALARWGLRSDVVMHRRARNEHLFVLRFYR